MIDPVALLNDLKPQVRALEDDLRERAADPEFAGRLNTEWRNATQRSRTAAPYESWLEGQITQAAVAWVLNTVFLRFCEDNRLIGDVFLSGRGERLDLAKEQQQLYFEQPKNASKTDREWIEEGLKVLAKAAPIAAGLFDRDHNPMWLIKPSLEAAKALITFWRLSRPAQAGDGTEDESVPVHDFTDPTWNTRFLGNLYQDLSEHAKKTYALLQTPEFVEEFILGLTLDEAINEFGLEPEPPEASPETLELPRALRVIDPTCGSGHFLLGAFHHILERWRSQTSSVDNWDLIHRTLYSVHGVDKNPFAVAIARFRLLLAAMQAGKVKTFSETPEFVINIAVGDSLIHGRGGPDLDQGQLNLTASGELIDDEPVYTYSTEDVSGFVKTVDLLGINSYHVVVGNPPYITVKDKTENANYRYYKSCSGAYALSVPFAERFFQLAIRGGPDRRGSGYVGQITANSFMKREFGKKLIEEFFPTIKLTHVIDTSGAYIPGHGTPTVILVGRRTYPRGEPIRAVLGIRGEPSQPIDPTYGLVWRAIVGAIDNPGSENEYVDVADLPGNALIVHPWNLNGGGTSQVTAKLEHSPGRLKGKLTRKIGFASFPGQDDVFFLSKSWFTRSSLPSHMTRPLVIGEIVRDWGEHCNADALVPYNRDSTPVAFDDRSSWGKHLWGMRTILGSTTGFGGETRADSDEPWWTWYRWVADRYRTPLAITFAFVATHNHFTLDRGGTAFKQSAPVIKLSEGASENEHLELLGLLNSSIACFWLKMMSQAKGGTDNSSGGGNRWTPEAWIDRYEFTGTRLEEFPLPHKLPLKLSRTLDGLAQHLESLTPPTLCSRGTPERIELKEAHEQWLHGRAIMVSLQEESDWQVYQLYGLLTEEDAAELVPDPEATPGLNLGERAFEIVLARRMTAGTVETQWFARHGSTPITELPEHWPEAYRQVVEKRIEIIEKRPQTIGLIERPEYKRRWATEPWEKKEKAALRDWLLARCEARELWFAADEGEGEWPRTVTVGRLADRLRDDEDFVSVARLYAGDDADVIDVLTDILDPEHVPFIAALRYKDSGMRKRALWERTWELQRQEDETGKQLHIPVPPKYTSADFTKHPYWQNRGKLDVPKERFISYPGASPDGDKTLLLGWAGWDHREQAHALMTLIEERTTQDGWELERLVPLIAGLAEVMPWVKQWHGEVDPTFGTSPADAYDGYLEQQLERHSLPKEELAKWRPPKARRGRAAKKKEPAE